MIFGRIGWTAWWLIVANVEAISARTGMTALNIRLIGEVLCWGVFSAGNWSAFTAAQADLFGTRPELMAKVGTTGGFCWDIGDSSGSLISAALAITAPKLSIYLSALCAVITGLIIASTKETLAKEKRKPFRLTEANPFGSLKMLVSYGPGLKQLVR